MSSSPWDTTAEGEIAPAPDLPPDDVAGRSGLCPCRRLSATSLISALLVHGVVVVGLLLAPRAPLEGGGSEEAAMIELVATGAFDTVDASAGSLEAVPAPMAAPLAEAPEASRPLEEPTALSATPIVPSSPPLPASAQEMPAEVPVEPAIAPAPAVAEAPLEPERPSVADEAPPVIATASAETAVAPPAPPPAEVVPPSPPRPIASGASRPALRAKPPEAASRPKRERRAETAPRPAPTPAAMGNAAADRRAGGVGSGAEIAMNRAGEVSSWRTAVLAALARAKRYPEDARVLGRTGRAAVTFTLRRDGSVVGVTLASSSGIGSIDRATLEMPHRAAFPPMPAQAGAAQTFTAGVRYDLH